MKVGTIFVMLIIFVFAVFLFPTVYDECQNVNASLTMAPVIKVFPIIFLIVTVLVPIYFGLKERD
jgi:formate-dependent nitrite reductase membrane component NrfD